MVILILIMSCPMSCDAFRKEQTFSIRESEYSQTFGCLSGLWKQACICGSKNGWDCDYKKGHLCLNGQVVVYF
jgi:hypothetical protein